MQSIIDISTKVLNEGLRPHLTQWQAKFRRWYEKESLIDENKDKEPQQIQSKYPQYSELFEDMQQVNAKIIDFTEQLKIITRA